MLGESAPHTVLLFFFFFFFCGLTHVSDSLLSQWKGPAEHTQVWILWSTLCVQLFFSTFKSCFKTWSTPTLHHYPAPSSFSSSSLRLQHYLKVNLSGWAAVSLFCCSDLFLVVWPRPELPVPPEWSFGYEISERKLKQRSCCREVTVYWSWRWSSIEVISTSLGRSASCVHVPLKVQFLKPK